MITYETYCQIRLLHDQRQLKAAQNAAELQLDLKTVEKWISQQTLVAHLASNYTRMTTIGQRVCYRRVQSGPALTE